MPVVHEIAPFRIALICLAALLGAVCPTAAFALDYNETLHGDLSDDPGAPTSLGTLPIGTHTLSASFVEDDYDLVTFTLAPGTRLTSIFLNSYAGSTVSFSGIQAGPVWTADLGYNVDPEPLLGWALFGETTVGTNILPDYATGAGAIGFTPPLQAGVYTLELQETGSFPVAAQFTVTVVPEPSTLAMAATACAAGLLAWRRKGRASL
jgi:hypothetical protein